MSQDEEIKVTQNQPNTDSKDSSETTVDELKTKAGEVFNKMPLLGPISWLYSQSRGHQHYFMSDINWLIMPPLMHDQYKLYIKDNAPLAYVSWAKVSQEVVERIQKSNQLRLAPSDWNSGDIIMIVDAVVPFGGMKGVVKSVRDSEFADSDVYMYMPAIPGQDEGKLVKLPVAKMPDEEVTSGDASLH